METYMKASGKMTKLTVWETTSMLTVPPTMESGKMTSSTEKEQKPGLMEQSMMAITMKVRNMARERYVLLMVAYIQATSSRMKSQERESTCGQIKSPMKANGRKIKCMAMAF